MDCRIFRQQIEFSLDGEPSTQEEARLRAHLEECPYCRQYRAGAQRLWGQLADLQMEPPGDIAGPVLARLARRKSWRGAGIAAIFLLAGITIFPVLVQGAFLVGTALLSLDWQWLPSLLATLFQAAKVLYKGWRVLAEALPQEYWLGLTFLAMIDLAMLVKIFRFKLAKGGTA